MQKRNLLIIWLAVFFTACTTETATPQIIYVYEPTKPEEQICSARFPDCHPWDAVSQYGGIHTCFTGRIERRLYVTDNSLNRSTWQVYFDPQAYMMPANRAEIIDTDTASSIYAQTRGLVVLMASSASSPPDEGSCVAVFGNVYNNNTSSPRLMMDSIGNPDKPTVIFEKCACGN